MLVHVCVRVTLHVRVRVCWKRFRECGRMFVEVCACLLPLCGCVCVFACVHVCVCVCVRVLVLALIRVCASVH